MKAIFKFEDATRSIIEVPPHLMLNDGEAIKYAYSQMKGHWPQNTALLALEIKFDSE